MDEGFGHGASGIAGMPSDTRDVASHCWDRGATAIRDVKAQSLTAKCTLSDDLHTTIG